MKPELHWSCFDLAGGWVMFGVDAYLSTPAEPESLLAYRRAVDPSEILGAENPGMAFAEVITEMKGRIEAGLGLTTQPLCASRAHAFEGEGAGVTTPEFMAEFIKNYRAASEGDQ